MAIGGNADAGVGEVDGVGRLLEAGRCRRRRGIDHVGMAELAETAMDGVLGKEGEACRNLADTGLDDEVAAASRGVSDQVVKNDEGVGAVFVNERQRLGVPVLDPDLRWHDAVPS